MKETLLRERIDLVMVLPLEKDKKDFAPNMWPWSSCSKNLGRQNCRQSQEEIGPQSERMVLERTQTVDFEEPVDTELITHRNFLF